MLGSNLLYQRCKVYRNTPTNEAGKSYVSKSTSLIGEYPCRLSRQNSQTIQGQPQTMMTPFMRMYLNMGADIQEGDRIEVDGRKYRVNLVYAPDNHHLEVELEGQVRES